MIAEWGYRFRYACVRSDGVVLLSNSPYFYPRVTVYTSAPHKVLTELFKLGFRRRGGRVSNGKWYVRLIRGAVEPP